MPFQDVAYSCHHPITSFASLEMLIVSPSSETVVDRSINLRRKVRPGLITLAAKDSDLIKDNNSLFEHFDFNSYKPSVLCNSESFLLGKRQIILAESIYIPKNVIIRYTLWLCWTLSFIHR